MMQKQAIRLQTETHMLLRMGELFQSLNKGLETRTMYKKRQLSYILSKIYHVVIFYAHLP